MSARGSDGVGTPRDDADATTAFAAYGDSDVGTPPDDDTGRAIPTHHEQVHFALQQTASEVSTPKTPPADTGAHGFSAASSPRQPGKAASTGNVTPASAHRAPFLSDDHRAGGGVSASMSMSPGGGGRRMSKLSALSKSSATYVSQRSINRETAHELARQALSHRKVSIGDITFENPRESNLRESVRRVQAYSRREAPIDYEMTASVFYKRRACQLTLDRETIEWKRGARVVGRIDTDDVVAAHVPHDRRGVFRVHYFKRGRGRHDKALRRKHKTVDFACEPHIAEKWVAAIQELVRWQARAPPISEKRRIKIVLNPHSGKRRARQIWHEDVKKFFDLGNFECVVEETAYAGHGIAMGKSYSADDGFEALVFVGGDGTLCEFMNGLLSRPEHEWREIVASTPISLISAGTQNAFGIGVGIPTTEAAVFCIIKRKIRPLDVITAVANQEPNKVHYSYCGVGWGVAGDIAAESERYRWMGTARYAFLKLKRFLVMPKRHSGRIRFVPTDPAPLLRKYYEIRDEGALDQFDVEEGSVYDYDRQSSVSVTRKSWGGFGGALRSPASQKRYPEHMWRDESGRYVVVGVVNAANDGKFAHPSDGNMDLIITRKGSLWRVVHLGLLYLVGRELESPLISYYKVKALVIEQDQPENCVNIDGEVLAGPGPWRMEIVPSLFKALSEK